MLFVGGRRAMGDGAGLVSCVALALQVPAVAIALWGLTVAGEAVWWRLSCPLVHRTDLTLWYFLWFPRFSRVMFFARVPCR